MVKDSRLCKQGSITKRPFFSPYARVNKYFYRLHSEFYKNSYKLMVFCLGGKTSSEKFIEKLSLAHNPFAYQRVFKELVSKAKELTQLENFKNLEHFLTTSSSFEKDYQRNKFLINNIWLHRNNLLEILFDFNKETQQKLLAITPLKDCHYALMALAFILTQKPNSDKILKLASLYARTGFLRGSLFIIEFCLGFNVWEDSNSHDSLCGESIINRNDALMEILASSLKWGTVGASLAKYMMQHYELKYSPSQMFNIIAKCDFVNPAIYLLLADIRHYECPQQIIKTLRASVKALDEYFILTPLEEEVMEKYMLIKQFVEVFPKVKLDKAERKALNKFLDAVSFLGNSWCYAMINALSNCIQELIKEREINLAILPLNSINEIEAIPSLEPLQDLDEFFNQPSRLPNNQKELFAIVANAVQPLQHPSLSKP